MHRSMLAAWVLAGGCVSHPSADRSSATDNEPLANPPMIVCGEADANTIALLSPAESESCPLALERDPERDPEREQPEREHLQLRPLARDNPMVAAEPIAAGVGPAACGPALQRCELYGVVDEALGPIVIAAERGNESEMPVQVFVGWVSGATLVFVETWYGPPSVVDHTRVGPVWALAPFDCDGELSLLPAPRLPEARHEPPSETLVALAGPWRLDPEGQLQPPSSPSSRTPESCRSLFPPLP